MKLVNKPSAIKHATVSTATKQHKVCLCYLCQAWLNLERLSR